MKKLIPIFLILALTACAQGTKEIEVNYGAYTHQILEQSKKEKVALANVWGGQYTDTIYSVKLVLKNCNYEKDWVDGHYYSWSGSLINSDKSYSFTAASGAMRTIPVYIGDCSDKVYTKKVSCYMWQDKDCIYENP